MPVPLPRDVDSLSRLAEFRLPPRSIELEDAVLGCILFDPGALALVEKKLVPECFTLTCNQTIYQAALELRRQDKRVDVMMMLRYLKDHDLLERAGGQANLARLMERIISAVSVKDYADALLGYYRKRELIRLGEKIAALGYQPDEWEPLIQEAERSLFALSQQQREDRGLVPMASLTVESFNYLEQISQGSPPGIKTGFYDLDSMTQGLQPQNLYIVAGRPSMGKSALVANLIYNIARSYPELTIPIFSLEMSQAELMRRFESIDSGLPATQIQSGCFSPEEWERFTNSLHLLSSLKIFIDDSAYVSVPDIASKCRQLKSQYGQLGPIVIDYLQLMSSEGGDNRVQEISKITRGLKVLARELDTPIIALSQLSRGVESRTNKRPLLSDLRDSGSVEQDSDVVILLYRDEYYNPDSVDRGVCELHIAKQRNGPVGTVKLLFESKLTMFRNAQMLRSSGYQGTYE